MPTSTRKNGITLIALIITIIVMLILVGVTINVALNGGLFQKAKLAADGTQKQAEKEELMSAAFGTVDSNGNLQITKTALEGALSQDWEINDEDTITDDNNQIWYTCTSPKGNIYYLNTTTGKIQESAPQGQTVVTPDQSDYTYTTSGNTATITGLSSAGIAKITGGITTEFSIPSEITEQGRTYTVTSIGDGAFLNCTNLAEAMTGQVAPIYKTEDYDKITKIAIPNTVTTIGQVAFAFSKANINLPTNVENIGMGAYGYCNNFVITQFPDSIETVGDYVFAYTGITSFTIQNSLSTKDIDWEKVLGQLSNLEAITIDLTSINDFDSLRCSNITIGSNVKTIQSRAFHEINYHNENNIIITFLGIPSTIASDAFSKAYGNNTFIVPWTQANKFESEPWGANEGEYVRFKYSSMAEGTYYYYKGGE